MLKFYSISMTPGIFKVPMKGFVLTIYLKAYTLTLKNLLALFSAVYNFDDSAFKLNSDISIPD